MTERLARVISRINKFKATVVIFIVFLLIGIFFVSAFNSAEKEADTAHTSQIASSYASSIEKVIRHALSSTNTLAVMVHQGKGEVPRYSELVKYMLPMYKGAYALSLAPEGVMRQIEPAIQNSLVKDHDLFEGKNRETELQNTREGELTFLGPFKLIQGPQGAVGMLPVFLNNPQGQKYFWGYTLVSLKFPDAFEDAQLSQLEKQGYAYELSGTNPFDGKRELIQKSSMPLASHSIQIPIKLYGTEFALNVSKPMGWMDMSRVIFEYLIIFVAASLMAWLSYSVLKLSEQRVQLNAIAMIDPLTNLPNRRLLSLKLDQILHDTDAQESCVVCYLDLDGFKSVNDRLGHATGDELLKIVSARLKSCVREHDVIARVGGDEFVLVLVALNSVQEAETIIARVIEIVNQPFMISGEIAEVTASLGAAVYKTHGDEADHLLRAADQAMYQAKNSGKNRFFFANPLAV